MKSELAYNTKNVEINPANLEREWINFPVIYFEALHNQAALGAALKRDKDVLGAIRAGAMRRLLEDPKAYSPIKGVDKFTDVARQTALDLFPEVQAQFGIMHETEEAYLVAQAYVQALESKKTSMENLVKLRNKEYYSEPFGNVTDVKRVENENAEPIKVNRKV